MRWRFFPNSKDAAGKAAKAELEATPARPDYVEAQNIAFLPAADFRIDACSICGGTPAGSLSVYPAPLGSRMRPRIVWWCEACGSGYVPNAKGFLANYYEAAYATEVKSDREASPEEYFSPAMREKSRSINRYFVRVEQQLEILKAHRTSFGAVLDFGSGPGYFLKAIDARRKLAVELDESSKKYLDHIGAEVVALDDVADDSLDLIMASHALEHLCAEELDATLLLLKAKLAPDGLLYVEVPQAALSALELPYKHEPHTIFFSSTGLEKAVRRAGFDVIDRRYRTRKRPEPRDGAIWTGDRKDVFQHSMRGGMTVIGRKPGANPESVSP